jgi:hypothetical protein
MRIEDITKLPKLYRVIKVDVWVLRPCYIRGETDTVVERKVRRVRCKSGWKWQIARQCINQHEWDYYIDEDQECIDNIP